VVSLIRNTPAIKAGAKRREQADSAVMHKRTVRRIYISGAQEMGIVSRETAYFSKMEERFW
jgi:hypothetical protein